jgi:hypothetical protein
MMDNANTPDSAEPQSSTPSASDSGAVSAPETPAAPEIIVAPDFDYVEMGESPEGTIEIEFEIKTRFE